MPTYLITYWDTEDYISPPRAGSDDIILKVRSLVGRGRSDVIREIARHHDPSLHYNYGSIHPTTCELMTAAGWQDGVDVALSREAPGFRCLENAFGRCTALTRHGTSFAAQIVRACALEGKAFWDSLVRVPESPVYWFCDALCFNSAVNCSLDTAYRDDAEFDAGIARVARGLRDAAKSGELLASFFGHPHRTVCDGFSDVPYYGGRNPLVEEIRPPAPVTDDERARVRVNLARAFVALRKLKSLQPVTIADLVDRFGSRPAFFTRREVTALARKVVDVGGPAYTDTMTAGEGLLALAGSLVLRRGRGRLPEHVLRRPVLGPLTVPTGAGAGRTLAWEDAVTLARLLLAFASSTGHLPAVVEGWEIGLGPATVAFAEAYLAAGKTSPPPVTVREGAPWPAVAEDMPSTLASIPGWPCHDPAMDVSRIVRYCQLMSWTIVPASAAPSTGAPGRARRV
jgi:hypothetical protein